MMDQNQQGTTVDSVTENMKSIKHKIMVMSNKGGVGKSSVSANLAYALAAKGHKVGVLDADLHGPSMLKAFGVEGERLSGTNEEIMPIKVTDNLCVVSSAAVVDNEDSPLIWRGPMKMSLIQQFFGNVKWGNLDYLIIDAPPGTGDEPLSVGQLLGKQLNGVVIVTTPQAMAMVDSRKAINFVKQMDIPILGLIENMAWIKCTHCDDRIELFKGQGGQKAAKEMNIDFLAELPFEPALTDAADGGHSFLEKNSDNETAKLIIKVATTIESKMSVPERKTVKL
jgi:ATP-binding protein involved in chromosome partitioning